MQTPSENAHWDVHVINLDGTGDTRLTSDPADDGLPAWSPDGNRIAFASNRTGAGDIYVMDADGSNVKRLTADPNVDDWPAWSTDGTRIAFQRAAKDDAPADIWVMNADGTHPVNLTHSPTVKDSGPSWR